MTSEEFEELLPAYLEGDLTSLQSARVEAWLKRSPEARESLEAYRELDVVLESRREQVPSAAPFFRAVYKQSLLSRARGVMTAAFSFPAISTVLLGVFSFFLFVYRDQITSWFKSTAEMPASSSLDLGWVRQALLQYSGADIWVVTGLYVVVAVVILASTSLMVMRYLRD